MPVLAAAHGHADRRGVPVAPSVRASFGNEANASSCSVTLPAGVQDGDVGVLVATTAVNDTLVTPTGWERIEFRGDQGQGEPGVVCYVWWRSLITADAGATVTLTRPASAGPITMVGVVAQGAEQVGVQPALGRDPLTVNPNGQTVRFPGIKPGPQDLVIAFGAARSYASTASTAPRMSSPPAGFTLRQNRSTSYPLGVHYAAWMLDGDAADANMVALTGLLGDQSYRMGGLLTVSPAGRRPTNELPASLADVAIHGYGASYLGYASDGYAHPSERHWYDRVARELGNPVADNNMGLPGAQVADQCGQAYGHPVYWTEAVQADPNFATQQAGTWLAQADRTGLVLWDGLGNDAFHHNDGGTPAKSLAGARNGLEAMVRLFRCEWMKDEADASVAFSAGWSDFANPDYSGSGVAKGSTTPGSTVTITTAEPDVDLVIFALDDTALGQVGAQFTVHVDGVQVAAGTTSDQMRRSSSGTYLQSAYTQMTVPLRDLGTGTKTIVITHAGAAGEGLYFDGYMKPRADPPWVVLSTLAHYDDATLAALNSSNAILDQYSQIARDVAALFPDGRVLIFDPLADGQWDLATMVTPYDSIHLTDVGAAHYAAGILQLLAERVA